MDVHLAEGPWAKVGTIAAVAVLALTIWQFWVSPAIQRRRLRFPAKAHFTIRNSRRSMSGRDVSQGDPHLVRRLVLPAHKESVVEIGLLPKTRFQLVEFVFGCQGERTKRPFAIERQFPFIAHGDSQRREEAKQKDYRDTNGYFHARIDQARNKGSHFVIGLTVRAEDPGLYPVDISFITDDIEGNFHGLEILVEDDPHTTMHCHADKHGCDCQVSPFDLPLLPNSKTRVL